MKNRFLIIAIILFAFLVASNAIARVLPVNEEMESQEDFILHNIDMHDLSGTSEYIVQEDKILPLGHPSHSSTKVKYKVCIFSNRILALIPKLTISNINVEQEFGLLKTLNFYLERS